MTAAKTLGTKQQTGVCPSADNEISSPLWHPMFQCRMYNSRPIGSFIRAMYPVHTVTSDFLVLASRLALSISLSAEIFYSASNFKILNALTQCEQHALKLSL